MKKIVTLLIVISVVMACGTSKTVRESKRVIKGEWTLSSVTYNQAGTYAVTRLMMQRKNVSKEGYWRFIPNNNSGVYTISKTGCAEGDRHFIFTIDEVDAVSGYYDFLLKPTDAKGRSETNAGYRMQLTNLSETMMTWQQTLTVEGRPFVITMNFIK